MGQIISTKQSIGISNEISLSNIPNGIYDINIQTETNTTHKKIVVQH
jgi:Secretion system C-terminal sorting domain